MDRKRTNGKPDAYFSCDVEADGAIPLIGVPEGAADNASFGSMTSFGLVFVGTYDGGEFTAAREPMPSFYRELKPITPCYSDEAAAVAGLDRSDLQANGSDPREAMSAAAAWVRQTAGDAKPVFVGWPLGFDWMWVYWYLVAFSATGSPFGHSQHVDMKTWVSARSGERMGRIGKRSLPSRLKPDLPHTHNALDDATEQGVLWQNLFGWDGTP